MLSAARIATTQLIAAPLARAFSVTPAVMKGFTVNFITDVGEKIKVENVSTGETVLDAALRAGIELEGSCESELQCSTCHVFIDEASMDKLPKVTDDELDMLDLCYGVQNKFEGAGSRLGCQVVATEVTDGMTVMIPKQVE